MQVLFVLMPSHIQYLTAGCSSVPGRQRKLRMEGLSSLHRPPPPKSSKSQAVSKQPVENIWENPVKLAPCAQLPALQRANQRRPLVSAMGTSTFGHALAATSCSFSSQPAANDPDELEDGLELKKVPRPLACRRSAELTCRWAGGLSSERTPIVESP
ncbi:hypothetical protein HDV57DRAFT_109259 [Trichoderma longibrachiatum]|uniref:Uncharacterized protein n=1 Tax=Trichoderma longibrachiatum ATCC 18648 TaxID=983965 RepID=A0A2T4C8W8_TRILO|nr:hypothetical protein M440DRAFT_250507 [Trichoderma longibrachiatum ATCC 18648]